MSDAAALTSGGISIAVGIIIGLLASLVQSLGLTIQRKSHVLNQALPEDQQRVEHRRPLWLLGFGIFFASNVLGSLVQIASLPVVILAPLGAVSLLWNAFFARLLLGDVFSPWMVVGTFLIAGGAVLIAIFGIVPEPTHSLDDLLALFRRPTFVAYFSLLGAVVVISLAITHILEYRHSRRHIELPPSPPLTPLARINAHDAPIIPDERAPLLHHDRAPSPTPTTSTIVLSTPKPTKLMMLLGMSYASFSGILSGMCLIFAKSGVELLMLTLGGNNQFGRWETWVLLLGLTTFALLQLWYLHKSLVLANPTLVCPLAFCWYNLSSIVNSLVYFDQFSLLSTRSLLLVSLGIVILLGGVWVVSVPAANYGGEGVEIGTWQEGDAEGAIFLQHDARASLDEDDGDRRVGLRRISTDIPPIPEAGPSSSPRISPTSPPTRHRKPTSLATSGPPFPSGQLSPPRRQSSALRSPTLPPGMPGPGFAIGLSVASPGFSVLPRRRIASGAGFADVVRASDGLRRTVSEGDSVQPGDTTSHLVDSEDYSFAREPRDHQPISPDMTKINAVHKRWRWLQSLVRRHD